MDDEVLRDPVDLGMVGITRTRTGDPVTDTELGHTRANTYHSPRGAIAQRGIGIQPVLDLPIRTRETLAANCVDDLLDLVRTGARLAQEGFTAELELAPLGPDTDHRVRGPDEETAWTDDWGWYRTETKTARARLTNQLFHPIRSEERRVGNDARWMWWWWRGDTSEK